MANRYGSYGGGTQQSRPPTFSNDLLYGGSGGGGGSTGPTSDPFNGPGSIDFDLTNPEGSVRKAATESGDVFSGLRTFLFGTDKPDVHGQHGGVLGLGNVPLVGDALRGISAVPGAVAKVASDAVGGVIGLPERLTLPGAEESVRAKFDALPEDSPAKQAAIKAMEADTGLFGTNILTAHATIMNKALSDYQQNEVADPSLTGGLFRPVGSLADAFNDLFGVLGLGQRIVERGISGGVVNRMAEIRAVGSGTGTFHGGQAGLTPVEQIAFDKTQSGEWTDDQANDFLASRFAGLSHDPMWELVGTFATDPMVFGSVGAGAIAKLGRVGMTLNQFLTASREGLAAEKALGASANVEKIAEYERAIANASAGIRHGAAAENVGKLNVVGKITRTQAAGDLARTFGRTYASLEGSTFGRMASVTRDIIDPMRPIGRGWSNWRNGKALASIEQGSEEVTRAVISGHGGEALHNSILYRIADTMGRPFVDQYGEGLGIYSAHVARRVAGKAYRTAQLLNKTAEKLLAPEHLPQSLVKDIMSGFNKRSLVKLEEEVGQWVKGGAWAQADVEALAERAATFMKGRTKEEWIAELAHKTWTPQAMSELHAATYGMMIKALHEAKTAIRAGTYTGELADKLPRLTVLSKQTLTNVGADGILTRIADAANTSAKIAEIETARRLYPELRNFVHDVTDHQRTIDSFVEMLTRRKNYLPSQILESERAGLTGPLKDLDEATRNVFTIGFRPEDQFLWGLEADGRGVLHEVGDPWFDEVSTVPHAYSGVRDLSFNVAGRPLMAKGARLLDQMEAMGRMARHGVTGKMVAQVAHNRFVGDLTAKYGDSLSNDDAGKIWESLMQRVDDANVSGGSLSGVRGLGVEAIWNAAKEVIPESAKHAGLDSRALMMHVLDAYVGDTRYIGLTQELTGNIKRVFFKVTGRNTAGEVAEHVWPLLKFRLNAFFQLQEKIEPWILNGQRGAHIAFGTKMTDADRLTAAVFKNFVEHDVVNMVDNDIAELGKRFLLQKNLERAAQQEGGILKAWREALDKIGAPDNLLDVQGVKQLNQLRTWQKGVGAAMKSQWEAAMPGEWEKMLMSTRIRVGEAISEDEFAIRMAAENLAANDVNVARLLAKDGSLAGYSAEYKAAITEGMWAAPQYVGDLKTLALDDIFGRLHEIKGVSVKDENAARRALASGDLKMEDIRESLRLINADPDYINRVESALTFSWPKFMTDVQSTFGLTVEQRLKVESLIRDLANQAGATPAEYLSQIYSPVIAERGAGGAGSLGRMIEMLRGGTAEQVPDLARLVGSEGASTIADFYGQFGRTMAAHLHPSAKLSFLEAMKPDLADLVRSGEIRVDIKEIERMFNDPEVQQALVDRIVNFTRGTPGTGAHTVVADEATGVAYLRDAHQARLIAAGRPPALTRHVMDDSEDVERRAAEALDAMPRIEHVATPAELGDEYAVTGGSVADALRGQFRPKASILGLDPATQSAYRERGRQARELYRHLTEDLHVRVVPVKGVPYADVRALEFEGRNARSFAQHFDRLQRKVWAHEKPTPAGGFTAEQKAMMARGDWEAFSLSRGYTAQEIADYKEYQRLQSLVPRDRLNEMVDLIDGNQGIHGSELFKEISTMGESRGGADAMRADLARKVLKVQAGGRWHPLYGSEDLFMQQAVHDAFGYGPEATPLGSHDAFFRQAALYDDEAKSVLYTDEFARQGWEKHSQEVIQSPVEIPSTVEEYEATYGSHALEPADMSTAHPDATRRQTRALGWGVRNLPEPDQKELLTTVSTIRNEFPGLDIQALDVAPLEPDVYGAAMGFEDGPPTIVLAHAAWGPTQSLSQATRLARAAARKAEGKVRFNVSTSRTGDIYHEMGHLLHLQLRKLALKNTRQGRAAHKLLEWVKNDLDGSDAAHEISEYAQASPHRIEDLIAELHDLSFNPEHSEEALLNDAAQQWRKGLQEADVWKPEGTPVRVDPNAGKTVAEVNAAAPGTIKAEHRLGLLPQDVRSEITSHFLGSGRYAEADPDVARMAKYLHEFMGTAAKHMFEEGAASKWAPLFTKEAGLMPVSEATPYNFTQARLMTHVVDSLAAKWEDSFRLQYFAQNRSMLQRSINHPMFGLYPASYMWGKIGPELIRFMAKEPFGMKTGALLYSIADMQKAVAVQRRWDPKFEKTIEALGQNPVLSMLGYMLPATPWSVPSSYPAWMRDMSQQGLAQQKAAASGKAIEEDNWITPLTSAVKKLAPYSTTIPWLGRAGDVLSGHDAASQKAAQQQPTPPPPPQTNLSEHVSATQLQPEASNWVADLQGIFK